MVTVEVVGQYPSISHDASLKALRKALDNTDDFTKMAEFVLKYNYFELNGKVKLIFE